MTTIEAANEYLSDDYLAWWERELTVEPASPDDAHRRLEKSHNLAASLSHVETRQVRPDYTVRWYGDLYQIERRAVVPGMRGSTVRVEQRLDGSLAARYGEQYVPIDKCAMAGKPTLTVPAKVVKSRQRRTRASRWNADFDFSKAPKIWQAMNASGSRRREE